MIPYEQSERVEVYADVRFKEPIARADREGRTAHVGAYRRAISTRRIANCTFRIPDGREIQVVTVRVRRIGRVAKVELPEWTGPRFAGDRSSNGMRVVSRTDLVGASFSGPLLLVDAEATTYIPQDWGKAAGSSDGVVQSC